MATEREHEACVVHVPELHIEDSQKINFVWGRGNKIVAFTSLRDGFVTGPSDRLNEIIWEMSLYNPEVRKLVSESSGIFMTLQRSAENLDHNSSQSLLAKISRMYRSVITACVANLHTTADATTNPELQSKLEEQSHVFYKMELIWSLCEILFIDIQPGGLLLHQLLDWIKWHFPDCERHAREAINSESPENHNKYWDAIFGYVLQGRMEEARKLLHFHSDFETDPFLSLDELLRKMPVYLLNSNQSIADFNARWHHWQDECKRRLEEGEFSSNKNLEVICRIICGDRNVFEEVLTLCETWYHMLVSRLLYTNPSISGYEIKYIVEESIDMFGGSQQMGPLDSILLSVLQFDLFKVIMDCGLYFDSWWFVAHLTDLLHHCKPIDFQAKSSSITLRESLMLDYATCLMSHHSLWQIAVDYLEYCPTYGRQYLETFLGRIPIDTEWKARKVLHIAQKHNLQDLARSICKIVGMQALQNGCLGSALTWALKSKDSLLATYLADKFLLEYSQEGCFSSLDLLDNLGSSMLVSDRLTFLGKYREFHKLYEEQELKAAAALLVSLLSSRLAPKQFWMTLLLDALPLLESDEVILSSEQTYELLYCLEELDKVPLQVQKQERLKVKTVRAKEKEDLIRLALARNLARTFINEQSID